MTKLTLDEVKYFTSQLWLQIETVEKIQTFLKNWKRIKSFDTHTPTLSITKNEIPIHIPKVGKVVYTEAITNTQQPTQAPRFTNPTTRDERDDILNEFIPVTYERDYNKIYTMYAALADKYGTDVMPNPLFDYNNANSLWDFGSILSGIYQWLYTVDKLPYKEVDWMDKVEVGTEHPLYRWNDLDFYYPHIKSSRYQ